MSYLKKHFNLGLLSGLLALGACSQSDIQQGSAQVGTAQRETIHQESSDSSQQEYPVDSKNNETRKPTDNASSPFGPEKIEESSDPQVAESDDDQALAPIAVPPVPIGGSFLSCNRGADEESFACVLEDKNKNVATPPADAVLEWSVVVGGRVVLRAAPFTVKVIAGVGPMYFVKAPGIRAGELQLQVSSNGAVDEFSFNVAPLFAQGLNLFQAVEVDSVPSSILSIPLAFRSLDAIGDGSYADEGDSCLPTLGERNQAVPGFAAFISFQGGNKELPAAYLKDICGLQSRGASIIVSGPPPIRPMKIMLTPGSRNLLLFRDQSVTNGTLRAQLDNSQVLPNGSIDDFNVASFVFIGGRASSTSNTNTHFDAERAP